MQDAGSTNAADDHLSHVMGALADPVRRTILERLSRGPSPVNQLVSCFVVTRPAVSRHLRVLRQAGLVEQQPVGRQRVYALRVDSLSTVEKWLDAIRTPEAEQRSRRLDALDTEVHRTRRERRSGLAHENRSDKKGEAS